MGVTFTDVVTEFIEGLVETYPGLQYLDGFPEVTFWRFRLAGFKVAFAFMNFSTTYILLIFFVPSRSRLSCVLMYQDHRMTKFLSYQVLNPMC